MPWKSRAWKKESLQTRESVTRTIREPIHEDDIRIDSVRRRITTGTWDMVRQRSQKLKSESRMVNPSLCTLEPSGERESLHLREREKERERESGEL